VKQKVQVLNLSSIPSGKPAAKPIPEVRPEVITKLAAAFGSENKVNEVFKLPHIKIWRLLANN